MPGVRQKLDEAANWAVEPAGSELTRSLGQRNLDRIGNALLRLERLTRDLPGVQLLGKAEWLNPGGSIKDRAAANMVIEGRRSGQFRPGKVLLDATSGNTGIAFAMIGAAEGFPVTLCMPENVSGERKRILHAYGANIIYTDPADGSDGAVARRGMSMRRIQINTFMRTSIQKTMPTGRLTTTARPTRSGNKRRDGSRTSLPCWVRAERLWAARAD